MVPETQIVPETQNPTPNVIDLTDDDGFQLVTSHRFKQTYFKTKQLAQRMRDIEEEFKSSTTDSIVISDDGKYKYKLPFKNMYYSHVVTIIYIWLLCKFADETLPDIPTIVQQCQEKRSQQQSITPNCESSEVDVTTISDSGPDVPDVPPSTPIPGPSEVLAQNEEPPVNNIQHDTSTPEVDTPEPLLKR